MHHGENVAWCDRGSGRGLAAAEAIAPHTRVVAFMKDGDWVERGA